MDSSALVKELDAIPGDDPEKAHALADGILLAAVPIEVWSAYRRLADRCSWWAFS